MILYIYTHAHVNVYVNEYMYVYLHMPIPMHLLYVYVYGNVSVCIYIYVCCIYLNKLYIIICHIMMTWDIQQTNIFQNAQPQQAPKRQRQLWRQRRLLRHREARGAVGVRSHGGEEPPGGGALEPRWSRWLSAEVFLGRNGWNMLKQLGKNEHLSKAHNIS